MLLDISEADYHSEREDLFGPVPNLTASTAKKLILDSPAHAYLHHPKLGGEPFKTTADMDRGTLIHAFLLRKGRKIAVLPFDDFKTTAAKELRAEAEAKGQLAVTERLFDSARLAARALAPKLAARGYPLQGKSEVTIRWTETTSDGASVPCRGRLDHVVEHHLLDLKITGDANPRRIERSHITSMGYDIQAAAYTRGFESECPEFAGRSDFTLLFCEPEPPHCITPIVCAGSLRELGARKWRRAVNRWHNCLTNDHWPEYVDGVYFAEARPWDIEAEESAA